MTGTTSLSDALALAQANMDNPPMNGVSMAYKKPDGSGASYSTLEDVLSVVRPACNAQGIYFSQPVLFVHKIDKSVAPDGSTFEAKTIEECLFTKVRKGDEEQVLGEQFLPSYTDEKRRGAQLTYFKRQQALAAFGLAGEEVDASEQEPSREPVYDDVGGYGSDFEKEKIEQRERKKKDELKAHLKERKLIANGQGLTDDLIKEWTTKNIGKPTSHMTIGQLEATIDYINDYINACEDQDLANPEPQDLFGQPIPID